MGRSIEKVIIIDNVEDNFKLQSENGLNIKNFLGEEDDNELFDLMPDLISKIFNIDIVLSNEEDVRIPLRSIREKMKKRYNLNSL